MAKVASQSSQGRMPFVLLVLWITNVSLFLSYFIVYGWRDLLKWVDK